MNKSKIVYLLVGRSSSGKDSVLRELNKLGYTNVISYTTRPRRESEGDTHIFIPPSEVEDFKKDVIAWTQIGNIEYFATKQQLLKSDIYIIDYEGVKYLKEKITPEDNIKFVTIYIYATQDECFERAMKRKDNIEVYKNRINAEYNQFKELETNFDFDYCIHNIDLNKTVKIVKNIMEVERE